jgi:hypothetical protein
MYTETNLIRIARRENNTKRNYLVVNMLQGKHIPVSPSIAFNMFESLAQNIKKTCENEKILFIGFAETATAIGSVVASCFDAYYIQTTRESIPETEYLFFSEEHSHATEQKLVETNIDNIIERVDRVIFVEDELTTGNTILNIVKVLEKKYPNVKKYSAAALLSGMENESLQRFKERNIDLYYLIKTQYKGYSYIADKFKGDGEYFSPDEMPPKGARIVEHEVNGYLDARKLVKSLEYKEYVEKLCDEVINRIYYRYLSKRNNVLVIGTEEFMYPAMYIGKCLEGRGKNVKCHSTTRSPIVVSSEKEYPVHKRYELRSPYDDHRSTYIYDIDSYDTVLVVTDAKYRNNKGINTLLNALKVYNNKIHIIRWC